MNYKKVVASTRELYPLSFHINIIWSYLGNQHFNLNLNSFTLLALSLDQMLLNNQLGLSFPSHLPKLKAFPKEMGHQTPYLTMLKDARKGWQRDAEVLQSPNCCLFPPPPQQISKGSKYGKHLEVENLGK